MSLSPAWATHFLGLLVSLLVLAVGMGVGAVTVRRFGLPSVLLVMGLVGLAVIHCTSFAVWVGYDIAWGYTDMSWFPTRAYGFLESCFGAACYLVLFAAPLVGRFGPTPDEAP